MLRPLPWRAAIFQRGLGQWRGISKADHLWAQKNLKGHLPVSPIFPDAVDHLGGLVNNLNFWAVFQTYILSGERTGRRCGLSNQASHLSDLVLRRISEIEVQLASDLPMDPSLHMHTFRDGVLTSPTHPYIYQQLPFLLLLYSSLSSVLCTQDLVSFPYPS